MGGAAYFGSTTILELSGLSYNTAEGGDSSHNVGGDAFGGGLWTTGPIMIRDSWLAYNTTLGGTGELDGGHSSGGGIEAGYDSNLTILNSLVAHNLVQGGIGIGAGSDDGYASGGGLHTFDAGWDNSVLRISNSTFSGNQAWSLQLASGGGLWVGQATSVNLSFCTIVNNYADDEGGGIFSDTITDNAGPVIKNTIIGDNSAPAGPQFRNRIQSRGYNLLQSLAGGTLDTLPLPNTGGGNVIGPPRVEALADNGGPTWTHALISGNNPSQAIDNGSPTDIDGLPVSSDQRGIRRPFPIDGNHDIGAFEFGHKIYLPFVVRD